MIIKCKTKYGARAVLIVETSIITGDLIIVPTSQQTIFEVADKLIVQNY